MRWIRYLVLFFFLSTTASVVFFRFVPPPLTPLMAIRYGEALFGKDQARLEKSWRPLEKISPRLAEAVIASEDQLFADHWGFDWDAILSAFAINGQGKRKLGASTITQQTAKNLFLWPDRSWTRKALEAYFTVELEIFWSKRRILEVYLNIIETGDGVYGAEAAARKYFGVPAAELNRDQAALIAAILPNPRKWSPVRPTAYLLRRQSWILRQMDHRGPLPKEWMEGIANLRNVPASPPRLRKSAAPQDTAGGGPSEADTLEIDPASDPEPTLPASPEALPASDSEPFPDSAQAQ